MTNKEIIKELLDKKNNLQSQKTKVDSLKNLIDKMPTTKLIYNCDNFELFKEILTYVEDCAHKINENLKTIDCDIKVLEEKETEKAAYETVLANEEEVLKSKSFKGVQSLESFKKAKDICIDEIEVFKNILVEDLNNEVYDVDTSKIDNYTSYVENIDKQKVKEHKVRKVINASHAKRTLLFIRAGILVTAAIGATLALGLAITNAFSKRFNNSKINKESLEAFQKTPSPITEVIDVDNTYKPLSDLATKANDSLINAKKYMEDNKSYISEQENNLLIKAMDILYYDNESFDALNALDNTLNFVQQNVENRINEEKEDKLCEKLAKEWYERIISNNSKKHTFSYSLEDTIEVVKYARANYDVNTDYNKVIDTWENFYNEALNTAVVANYDKSVKAIDIDTEKIFEGTNVDGVEVINAFETNLFRMFNAANKSEKKEIIAEAGNAYLNYMLTAKENNIEMNGQSNTFTAHDILPGIVQKTILYHSVFTMGEGLIYSNNWLKVFEDLWWQPEYFSGITTNEEWQEKCDSYNYSEDTQKSYSIKAHTDFRDDVLKKIEDVKSKNESDKDRLIELNELLNTIANTNNLSANNGKALSLK